MSAWTDVVGPQGPVGPTGPQGPTGAQGPTGPGTQILAKGTADVAVTLPISTYTDVLSVPVPAGKISPGCFVRWKLVATLYSPTQGNWRSQIKLGATILHVSTGNFPTITAGNTGLWILDLLVAFPTITSQRSALDFTYSTTGGVPGVMASGSDVQGYDVASEDFSGTKNITFCAYSTAAIANNICTVVEHVMELIS